MSEVRWDLMVFASRICPVCGNYYGMWYNFYKGRGEMMIICLDPLCENFGKNLEK